MTFSVKETKILVNFHEGKVGERELPQEVPGNKGPRWCIQFLLCQFIHLFFHPLPSAHYSFFSLVLQSLIFLLSVSAGGQDILVHEGFDVHKGSSSQPWLSLTIRIIGGREVFLKDSWQWHSSFPLTSSFPITMSSLRARISIMHFPAWMLGTWHSAWNLCNTQLWN